MSSASDVATALQMVADLLRDHPSQAKLMISVVLAYTPDEGGRLSPMAAKSAAIGGVMQAYVAAHTEEDSEVYLDTVLMAATQIASGLVPIFGDPSLMDLLFDVGKHVQGGGRIKFL